MDGGKTQDAGVMAESRRAKSAMPFVGTEKI